MKKNQISSDYNFSPILKTNYVTNTANVSGKVVWLRLYYIIYTSLMAIQIQLTIKINSAIKSIFFL